MSLIMWASEHAMTGAAPRVDGAPLDPNVRSLLDHIAVELAEEYIRLMRAAAEDEIADEPPKADA